MGRTELELGCSELLPLVALPNTRETCSKNAETNVLDADSLASNVVELLKSACLLVNHGHFVT